MRDEYDLLPPWSRAMWAVGLASPLLLLAAWLLLRPASEPSPKGAIRQGSPGLRAAIEAQRR